MAADNDIDSVGRLVALRIAIDLISFVRAAALPVRYLHLISHCAGKRVVLIESFSSS
jgi:hypothetical protein